eukprot:115339-Chlamydomonas_euryale.AAC.1
MRTHAGSSDDDATNPLTSTTRHATMENARAGPKLECSHRGFELTLVRLLVAFEQLGTSWHSVAHACKPSLCKP